MLLTEELPGVLLASQSPRRRELLEAMGISATYAVADVDERGFGGELDLDRAVKRLAEAKRNCFADHASVKVVIGADTIVSVDGKLLGKPADDDEARTILHSLAGRWHLVSTGVALAWQSRRVSFAVQTQVRFAGLSVTEVEHYVASGACRDKAGAYGIQDWLGTIGVSEIRGDFNNVVGLPTARLWQELKKIVTP